MKRFEKIIVSVIFIIAYFVVVSMLSRILPPGPSSIRYEVALTIIGTVITVMGILITFEITFPARIYYKAIESIFGFLYDYKEILKSKGRVPEEMREYRKGLEKRTKNERKRFKEIVISVIIGLIIIIGLIVQAFNWQIDPKTNLISPQDFENLQSSLVVVFVWIILSILLFHYIYHMARFDYVLKEFEKIEEIEKKNAGNKK